MIKNSDLFDLLDIVEQEKFSANFKKHNSKKVFDEYLKEDGLNFYDFILGGFSWDSTNEGFDYWRNLAYENRYVADMVDVYYNNIYFDTEEDIVLEDCKSIQLPKFLAERIADEMLINGLITSYLVPALTNKNVTFKNQTN